MQKVIRRTILAEKQAVRRAAKRQEKKQREWRKNTLEQARFQRKDEVDQIKKAREALREDWELGPLAPKRDAGNAKETYGTINTLRSRGPVLTQSARWEQRVWVGGKYPTIMVDDRVAVVEGRDMGKIGVLMDIDFQRGECKVEGLNMVDIKVPEYMLVNEADQDKRKIRSIEQPIPLSSIRLVATLTTPSGSKEDVVCEKVHATKPFFDKMSTNFKGARVSYHRYIIDSDGTEIRIPFPLKEPKEHKDTPSDTLRMEVEQNSFVPTLLRPPMPGSVIDELRNKYSIFRTRHDPDYIAAKMKEDEEKEEKQRMIEKMRTPLKEANRIERKMKRAKGKGILTEEMLEKIGEVIAKKKQLQLDAAGLSTEPPKAVVA